MQNRFGSLISLFGLSAILKIRCVERAHYEQLAAASARNREKQMFVVLGKEFDLCPHCFCDYSSSVTPLDNW